jgi:hypothetical protein
MDASGRMTEDLARHYFRQLVDTVETASTGGALEVVATVEAAAVKRLRAKEEIQRMGRLNSALEERVKSLYVEAQVWRDLA